MFAFSEENKERIPQVLAKYPTKQSALLPLLTMVQRQEGYVQPEAMVEIGKILELSPGYVQSVASFYTMYHMTPTGKYIILFCINISCQLNGADELLNHTAQKLNIKVGETTQDKKFTLHREECLAACSNAPMMRINDDYYEDLTKEKIDQILDSLD
ncbi:MAG: NADH-quinone oxidoreductase subunit NuoE [Candidatus Nitrohelix vancouverensis]|uniref:NADH-quinone oxidoreductase subunit NuoE n=1 Tax=Candidatus Nitrohelix vancouverensis TaxID=2705534 RepID=A0A7T0G4P0_9BACT|nr:MAG: NADH-quinone oxidoreductase subunit NuoE [Candidatus Nitrohelix vancouverensis]